MNTINTVSNSSTFSIQNNNQVSAVQEQKKVHHHHKSKFQQDSIQISDDSKQDSSTKTTNPLDSLVANGTITQDQENAIKSAFISARQQASQPGTYSINKTNPISSLVANGTITQTQADSITNAFKSPVQPDQSISQVTNSQEQHHVHHHHHVQGSQEVTQSNQAAVQAPSSTDNALTNALDSESQENIIQNQETAV